MQSAKLTLPLGEEWKEDYSQRIERNLGIISREDQVKLKRAKVAVLGTGGIGGPCALNLAYSGVMNFVMADFDIIELSNLNRQPYTRNDVGKYKVDVLAHQLQEIDGDIAINTYHEINEHNIEEILQGVDVVILSLDGPVGSILVSRVCREKNIPMVEGWATPIVFSRWFTQDSVDYETCYGLMTHQKSISEIQKSKELQMNIKQAFMSFLVGLPGIIPEYQHDLNIFTAMMQGQVGLRSFSPMVWAVSIYLAHDVIFAGLLSNRKEKVLAPSIHGFDFMHMKEIKI